MALSKISPVAALVRASSAPVVMQPSQSELVAKLVVQRFAQARKLVARPVRRWLNRLRSQPWARHRLQLRHELLPILLRTLLDIALPNVAPEARARLADQVVNAAHTRAAMLRATPEERAELDESLRVLMEQYHELSSTVLQRGGDRNIDATLHTLSVFELQSFLAEIVAIVKWLAAALSLPGCLRALRRPTLDKLRHSLGLALDYVAGSDPEAVELLRERRQAQRLTMQLLGVVAPVVLKNCHIAPRVYAPPEVVKRPGIGEVEISFPEREPKRAKRAHEEAV